MPKIRIIDTPPGFAPEYIREQWVGLIIPLPTDEQIAEDPPSGSGIGNENVGGYHVLTSDAITALEEAEEQEAASYWRSLRIGRYLRFHNDVCEVID